MTGLNPHQLAALQQLSENMLVDQAQPLNFVEVDVGGGVYDKVWSAEGPMLPARFVAAGQNAREPVRVDAIVSEIPMIVSLPVGTVLDPSWRLRGYVTINDVIHITVYKVVGPHNTPRSFEAVTKYLLLGPVPEVEV